MSIPARQTTAIALTGTDGEFAQPVLALSDFGSFSEARSWLSSDIDPRILADVNGDGLADIVGFHYWDGTWVSVATGGGQFAQPVMALDDFGSWWDQDFLPRQLADVNNDGLADIVGFGDDGTWVSLASGGGDFAQPVLALDNFGSLNTAGGWQSAYVFPRQLADVSGDGLPDIVGFGYDGVWVSLATGGGAFAQPVFALDTFGASDAGGNWSTQAGFPRQLADVNNDGLSDIVAFGYDGTWVSLATGGGNFAQPVLALDDFGASEASGGWSTDWFTFKRQLADVSGDGLPDIVGFGFDGVWVSLATGGGAFAEPVLALDDFGASHAGGGWSSQDAFPRELADVNGDGMADIVGFGYDGTRVSLATGGGAFAQPVLALDFFGASFEAGSWIDQDQSPRQLADVNGDGLSDIVGFGDDGTWISLAIGGGAFAQPVFDFTNLVDITAIRADIS